MKILVFDEWIPWPLDSGKKIRTYNLLKRLSDKHDIIFLAYAKKQEEQDKINIFNNIFYRLVVVDDVRKRKMTLSYYSDVLINYFENVPFSTKYHVTNEYNDKLQAIIIEEKPDLIHCEWTNYAPYLQNINNIPYVIASHNIESQIWSRLAHNTNNIIKKMVAKQQATKLEALESYWYPKAECTITVSENDKAVAQSYGANVALVENGVDTKYYSEYLKCDYDPNVVIFTASYDTFSNQDAAYYFIDEIYPIIKKNNPLIKVYFVGREPPRKLLNYSIVDPSIKVTGTVLDVRPYLALSSICIVPLRIGGGSRLKILEAMAIGKPVISTTIGAEGLDVEDSTNIIIEDNPLKFAENVLVLLDDNQKRNNLIDAALNLVKSKYDWDILAEKQHYVWMKVMNCPFYRYS